MTIATALIQSAATIPSLASRPFLGAFGISLLARFGAGLVTAPAWFIADATLSILAILAVVEIAARKDSDIQAWLDEFDALLKSVVSLIVTYSMVDAESAVLLSGIAGNPGSTTILSVGWSAVTSVGTWAISGIRNRFFLTFTELDEDDDSGLQTMMSWIEDIMATGGIVLAILFPVLALALFGITLLILIWIQKSVERRAEKSKIPCPQCNTPLYPMAVACPKCQHPNSQLFQIGFFGQPTQVPVQNKTAHQLHLLTHKRCPICATHLKEKAIRQTCPTCGTETFSTATAVDTYLTSLQPPLIRTMLICFALGFIPLIGLVPGIIYYRLSLISSVRHYIPRRVGCLVRWGIRLLNFFLILLQPIPILGAFTLPLMCYSNYYIYRKVIHQESKRTFHLA